MWSRRGKGSEIPRLIEEKGFSGPWRLSSPVSMDDDFGRAGSVEVGGLLGERLLVEGLCTVHVSPRQQQVLDLQLESLLPVAPPCGVVDVRALIVPLPFLYTWWIRGNYFTGSE